MATRPVVPQQPRGEAVAAGNKHTKEIRCCRWQASASDFLSPHKGFCAQLLTNAQAAATAENNKKNVCVNVDKAAVPVLLGGLREGEKREGEGSSKKKAPTLTSVLTARSKAACGIEKKPKEVIVDIDAADANNDLAGVEYVEDIYKFYKSNESRPNDDMHLQTDMNEKMRKILVDWLIDVHLKFELSPETLYLTINIIDRHLSVKVVPRRELQLVEMGAMLMASKYEEIWAPEVNDLVCIADRAYSHEQILVMEKTILGKLASIPDERMENMVFFLAELGMMQYETIMFCPSMVAASAVYAACCTPNKKPAWTDTLKHHTGCSEEQLMDCAKLLVHFHSKAAENRLQAVYRKYSSSLREAVALLQSAQFLISPTAVKSKA
ncbi:hypothetical protein SLE2022_061050 [Rubroshorea leprosula]